MGAPADNRFPRSRRLIRAHDFAAVFDAGVRATAGPLIVWAAPNDCGHCRLGLAISRRLGNAALRNRVRRLVRESFRLMRDDLPRDPRGYDVVVTARRHEPLTLDEYSRMLADAVRTLECRWRERTDTPDGKP